MHWRALGCVKTCTPCVSLGFAGFSMLFCSCNAQHTASFTPQELFTSKPLRKPLIHKHCFYTSPAFTQQRFYMFLHKTRFYRNAVFTQALCLTQVLLLYKPCLETFFAQDLLLHKCCLYISAVFTQALLVHKKKIHKTCVWKRCLYASPLSIHKHCFYTSPAFTQRHFSGRSLL